MIELVPDDWAEEEDSDGRSVEETTVELLVGSAVDEVETLLELVVLGGTTVLLLLLLLLLVEELVLDVLGVVLVVVGSADVLDDVLLVDVGLAEVVRVVDGALLERVVLKVASPPPSPSSSLLSPWPLS